MDQELLLKEALNDLAIRYAYSKDEKIKFKDLKAEELNEKLNLNTNDIDKIESDRLIAKKLTLDEMVEDYIRFNEKAMVIHIGCGLDTMKSRIKSLKTKWYYLDCPIVADKRKDLFPDEEIFSKTLLDEAWTDEIKQGKVSCLVILENTSMYLKPEEITKLFKFLGRKYENVTIFIESVSKKAMKKNPSYLQAIKAKGFVKLDKDFDYVKHMNGSYGMKKLHFYYNFVAIFNTSKFNTITSLHKN